MMNIEEENKIKNRHNSIEISVNYYKDDDPTEDVKCGGESSIQPSAKKNLKLRRETYDEYLETLINRNNNPRKDQWIYNIINGTAEQNSIIYRDKTCLLIPNYKWNNEINKLHIIAIPTDITLRSIRSLRAKHIVLLEHIKSVIFKTIKMKYDLGEENVNCFFHYEPSVYHLHIHVTNLMDNDARSSVEYSHDLNTVIYNLSIKSDYYVDALLNVRYC